jgi:lactaldehyde reductase
VNKPGSNPSANVGLVHGMSHALGARHGVAHGMGNAILLPHVMRFNSGRPEGAKRLRDVAIALGLAVGNDAVEAANLAADKVTELLVATGHPVKLAEVKVPKDDLEPTAESAFLDPANLYNARAVSFPAEITELYQGAY